VSLRLSLCLIVKNEERFLEACVTAARPLVEDVVIADTGSTDGTVAIAHALGARVIELPFTGDFSAARNSCLDVANGDWVLFLDADEVLPASEHGDLLSVLNTALEGCLGLTFLRYNYFNTGGFYASRELRCFRRVDGLRYERAINESVRGSIDRLGGFVTDADILLNHFGFCRPVAEREAKAERYLSLFDAQVAKDPGDAFSLAFEGLILRTIGRMDEARAVAASALQLAPNDPLIHLFHGHVVRATDTPEAALRAYEDALQLAPTNAALRNMVGVQLLATGEPERAREFFRAARAVEPKLWHTWINEGFAFEYESRMAEALDCYQIAARRNPAFMLDTCAGRCERDYFRSTYYETPFGFGGLALHLGRALAMEAGSLPFTSP